MTERRPPQARGQATRARILTAAADHFARDGYYATSLDRVLPDSGATKGAMYHHFASKLDLARGVLGELVCRHDALHAQVRDRGLDPLTALVWVVDGMAAGLGGDDPVPRGGTRLATELGPDEPQRDAFGERRFLSLLTDAEGDGSLLEAADPAVLSRHVAAALAGHHLLSELTGDRAGLRRRIDAEWCLLLPAIAAADWLERWRSTYPRRCGADAA